MNARREEEAPYETRFNPNLPWGYWLVATGETDRNDTAEFRTTRIAVQDGPEIIKIERT